MTLHKENGVGASLMGRRGRGKSVIVQPPGGDGAEPIKPELLHSSSPISSYPRLDSPISITNKNGREHRAALANGSD